MMKTRKLFTFLFAASVFSHAAGLPAPAQAATSNIKHIFSISEGLRSPLRIAVTTDDYVYVADVTARKICKYNLQGNLMAEINLPSVPLALSVTPEKQLLIGDPQGRLQLFDAGGVLLKPAPNPYGIANLPVDAAMDDDNNLYLVDSNNKSVKVFNATGALVRTFGSDIMIFPTSITIDHLNNRLLVADHGGLFSENQTNGLIHIYDFHGNYLSSFAEFGTKPGQFSRIQGITIDQSGHILAADPFQGKVTILDKNGAYLGSVGRFGTEAGEFQMPMDVAVDSKNQLWVASTNTGRVEVFALGDPVSAVTEAEAPAMFSKNILLQNFPNPFKKGTWIPFIISENSHVTLRIYSGVGRLVRTIDAGDMAAGAYDSKARAIFWDGTSNTGERLSTGLYFCKFAADDFSAMKRLILLK